MENKLAIIDGSSLLYRAFYALPPTMTSPDGVPTNAVYGFLRMLLSLYRELDPAYVAVTFDKDRQTFRMEMYDGYKATRKPAPAELVPQFDLILEVMHVMGVAVYSLSGYEGDDVLGGEAGVFLGLVRVSADGAPDFRMISDGADGGEAGEPAAE